jgi:hypothetical protein
MGEEVKRKKKQRVGKNHPHQVSLQKVFTSRAGVCGRAGIEHSDV